MTPIAELGADDLRALRSQLNSRYQDYASRGLALDMTRGKPCSEQLDIADALLALPGAGNFKDAGGTDCRNYGGLDGLPEMKALFGGILGLPAAQMIVGGNASLTLMHDALVRAMLFGVPGGDKPWKDQGPIKFLCPVPGYDRHFAITEHLGFELISVPMNDHGPDMDAVREQVRDHAVKGIWCVPKYSNPTGVTYAQATIDALAEMPAAADFRIFWDNAYAEHHLGDEQDELGDIYATCERAGNADRVLMFASTSKISLAGAGVAALGASPANVADAKTHIGFQSIGPDKINQLRHLRFFKDLAGLRAHMRRHAEIIRPKFELVYEVLDAELTAGGTAQWTHPRGGYFISLDVTHGSAREVVRMAAEAGVKLTAAGAPFPYGRDPQDRNIRIAPTFPAGDDIRLAMEVLAVCIQLDAVSRRLNA